MIAEMVEIRRFEYIDTDLISWDSRDSCSKNHACNLWNNHDSPCADVSLSGLVLDILHEPAPLTAAERKAMSRLHAAYSDLQDAVDEIDRLEWEIKREGPARVKKLLEMSYHSTPYVDWPIGATEEEWIENLKEYESA